MESSGQHNIKFYLNFCRIFGIMSSPIQVKSDRLKSFRRIVAYFPAYVSLFLFAFSVFGVFWHINVDSELTIVANWIQIGPNTFAYLYLLISATQTSGQLMEINRGISECFDLVQGYGRGSEAQKNPRVLGLSLLFVVLLFAIFLTTVNYLIGFKNLIPSMLHWVSFCYPKLALMAFTFLFVLMQLNLSKLFRTFAASTRSMYRSNSNFLLPPGGDKEQKKLEKGIIKVASLDGVKMDILLNFNEQLSRAQVIIYRVQETVDKMNSYYGKKMLFSTLSGFVCITVQLYYLLNNIRTKFAHNNAALYVFATSTLITMHSVEFFCMFFTAQLTQNLWMQVAYSLQLLKDEVNEELSKKIDSLVEMCTLFPIRFTAFEIFPIDMRVICGMAASITSYLIVLLQFGIDEDKMANLKNTNITRTNLTQFRENEDEQTLMGLRAIDEEGNFLSRFSI